MSDVISLDLVVSSSDVPLNIHCSHKGEQTSEEHSPYRSLSIHCQEQTSKEKTYHAPVLKIVSNWPKKCKEIVKKYQKIKAMNLIAMQIAKEAGSRSGGAAIPKVGQWNYSYQKLLKFHKKSGHCLVPCEYEGDLSLARWVKRQRYQYYLLVHGKKASMNQKRVKMLDDIGFIWQAQDSLWQERFQALLEFKKEHGHCSIPTDYPLNQKLATWVKFQRRQYRLHREGFPSYISDERIAVLDKHGFQWSFFQKKGGN